MKIPPIHSIILALMCLSLPACKKHDEHAEAVHHKVVVTSPKAMDVVVTRQYVCQIHSQRHIKVRALEMGYLEAIPIKEGQLVKKDQVMFTVISTLYKAKWDAEVAEAQLALQEKINTKALVDKGVVTDRELVLYEAKLARANAKAKLAEAEFNFTKVRAPFDGIIDRLHEQQGSLVKEGDALTTLSDNSLMWVYFNVPEARYLEYVSGSEEDRAGQRIELVLANGRKFEHVGKLGKDETTGKQHGAIEARFNNETGTIPFRADFPNPKRLLRHGMTGNIVISTTLHNAIVIPQRATFEILDKQYVYVVDKDDVVHQREIKVLNELENVFVIKSGLAVDEKIVYEGTRQVHDGQKVVDYEFSSPEKVMANQNHHAE